MGVRRWHSKLNKSVLKSQQFNCITSANPSIYMQSNIAAAAVAACHGQPANISAAAVAACHGQPANKAFKLTSLSRSSGIV